MAEPPKTSSVSGIQRWDAYVAGDFNTWHRADGPAYVAPNQDRGPYTYMEWVDRGTIVLHVPQNPWGYNE